MIPKVTAAIPTYSRPDLVARAIKSVQLQEFEDWELIVFSDHCPKAKDVYENFFRDDSRIIFVDNPNEWVKNVGAIGINYALENARSNIITYLCDDNMFLPNHFGSIYNELKGGGHSVVETLAYHIDIGSGDGKIREILERGFTNDINFHYKTVEQNMLDGNVISCGSDMIRLGHTLDDVLSSVGYWTPWCENVGTKGYNEDGNFMKRLGQVYSKKSIQEYTGVYYARGSCVIRDEEYHNKVNSLSKDEVFVYPDLMKDVFDYV